MKYTCNLYVDVQKTEVTNLVRRAIDNLNFKPFTMSLFFNEFKKSKFHASYDLDYILKNLSIEEMQGISAVSLYDSKWSEEDVTPSFKIEIYNVEGITSSRCTFEWIAYSNLDMILQHEHIFNQLLSEKEKLIYCYAFEQEDAHEQTLKSDENDKNSWGRYVRSREFDFIAAPLMYFGPGSYEIIPKEKLLNCKYAQEIQLHNQRIVKITLFDLYEDPRNPENRDKQKYYWKTLQLDDLIANYDLMKSIDPIAFVNRRKELYKKQKK